MDHPPVFNSVVTMHTHFSPDLVNEIIHNITDNFPEASEGVTCTKWNYNKLLFTFVEEDTEGKTYKVGPAEWLAAFHLMFTSAWPKGLTTPPLSGDPEMWQRWYEKSDADDFDAFAQLAIFGEVIYG